MDVKEFKLEISAIQLPRKDTSLVTFTFILGSSCTKGFVRSFKKKNNFVIAKVLLCHPKLAFLSGDGIIFSEC